jgi:hypothetical protein
LRVTSTTALVVGVAVDNFLRRKRRNLNIRHQKSRFNSFGC